MSENRIVSLLASATEIVCALGQADQLVGISHECDFPSTVLDREQCTEAKFMVDGLGCEIDERIKSIVRDGLSVYRVFPEKLDELKPDVIITQSQCEVCAVSLKDVEEAVEQMASSAPRVVSLEPHHLADVWDNIQNVADSLGLSEQGEELLHRLRERVGAIARDSVALSDKPTVACIEWVEPLMTAGNWMPELVTMAGGINRFGEAGQHSQWMTWENLVAEDPDVVLVFPCGWSMERTREEMKILASKGDWFDLDAVKKNQVYLIDGNHYCNRPGPRLVETLEILAEIFHPQQFDFGHRDIGWAVY